MPRKVAAYGCSFLCGARVQTNKQAMVKHEETCFSNEENKACKTCHHNWFDTDTHQYICELELQEDGKPTANCQDWKSAEENLECF